MRRISVVKRSTRRRQCVPKFSVEKNPLLNMTPCSNDLMLLLWSLLDLAQRGCAADPIKASE
jgi:hypothetical protein